LACIVFFVFGFFNAVYTGNNSLRRSFLFYESGGFYSIHEAQAETLN